MAIYFVAGVYALFMLVFIWWSVITDGGENDRNQSACVDVIGDTLPDRGGDEELGPCPMDSDDFPSAEDLSDYDPSGGIDPRDY